MVVSHIFIVLIFYVKYNKIMINSFLSIASGNYAEWGQIILKVGLGLVFVIHGWPKIKNPKGIAGFLTTLNIRPTLFWAVIIAVSEFFGGLVLVLSSFISFLAPLAPIAAALIAIVMLVAIIKVKRKFVGGWEFDFALLVMAITIILLG